MDFFVLRMSHIWKFLSPTVFLNHTLYKTSLTSMTAQIGTFGKIMFYCFGLCFKRDTNKYIWRRPWWNSLTDQEKFKIPSFTLYTSGHPRALLEQDKTFRRQKQLMMNAFLFNCAPRAYSIPQTWFSCERPARNAKIDWGDEKQEEMNESFANISLESAHIWDDWWGNFKQGIDSHY